jgi:hypothetical protein
LVAARRRHFRNWDDTAEMAIVNYALKLGALGRLVLRGVEGGLENVTVEK